MTTKWPWPLDLAAYDRSAGLTRDECSTLQHLPAVGASYSPSKALISCQTPRLMQPLNDAFDYIGYHRGSRSAVSVLLLREMSARRRSFWAWTEGEWLATVRKRVIGKHEILAAAYQRGASASRGLCTLATAPNSRRQAIRSRFCVLSRRPSQQNRDRVHEAGRRSGRSSNRGLGEGPTSPGKVPG